MPVTFQWWVEILHVEWFSPNYHLGRTWSSLSSHLHKWNWRIWWQRHPCLEWHYVGQLNTTTCLQSRAGIVNAHRYRNEVLETYLRYFRGAVSQDFMFMNDNVKPHRKHILFCDFLEEENIRCVYWSSRSPNLNPIEYVWYALRKTIT